MKKFKILFAVMEEYGIKWLFHRLLYSLKIRTLRLFPKLDILFEKKIHLQNLNILSYNKQKIEEFLVSINEKEKKQVISEADEITRGRIIGFSNIELDYGYPINWYLNPGRSDTILAIRKVNFVRER